MTNTTSGDKIKALMLRVTSKVQGMGIFFLVMPLAQTWLIGHEYMCYVCEITLRTCDISEMSRQGRPITWPLTGSFQNGLLRPKP